MNAVLQQFDTRDWMRLEKQLIILQSRLKRLNLPDARQAVKDLRAIMDAASVGAKSIPDTAREAQRMQAKFATFMEDEFSNSQATNPQGLLLPSQIMDKRKQEVSVAKLPQKTVTINMVINRLDNIIVERLLKPGKLQNTYKSQLLELLVCSELSWSLRTMAKSLSEKESLKSHVQEVAQEIDRFLDELFVKKHRAKTLLIYAKRVVRRARAVSQDSEILKVQYSRWLDQLKSLEHEVLDDLSPRDEQLLFEYIFRCFKEVHELEEMPKLLMWLLQEAFVVLT